MPGAPQPQRPVEGLPRHHACTRARSHGCHLAGGRAAPARHQPVPPPRMPPAARAGSAVLQRDHDPPGHGGVVGRCRGILDHQVSDTTLRARRDEWIHAGVFEQLKAEALAAFDRIVGLDLDDVALDGSLHKAPYGGEGTGANPTDRAKLGWKWSVASERHEIPVGWAIDGANRNDVAMLEPTIDAIDATGLLDEIGTCISTGAMTRARCVIDCGPGASPSSRSSAVARRSPE